MHLKYAVFLVFRGLYKMGNPQFADNLTEIQPQYVWPEPSVSAYVRQGVIGLSVLKMKWLTKA